MRDSWWLVHCPLDLVLQCIVEYPEEHSTGQLCWYSSFLSLKLWQLLPSFPAPCLFACFSVTSGTSSLPPVQHKVYAAVPHAPCCNLLPPDFVSGMWIEESDTCKRMATHRISFPGPQLPHKDSQEWRMDSPGRGKREVTNVQPCDVSFLNSLENSDGSTAKT